MLPSPAIRVVSTCPSLPGAIRSLTRTVNARTASVATLVVLANLWRPTLAAACGCLGTIPSSTAARNADVVFVGRVTRIDSPRPISPQNAIGPVRVELNAGGPDLVMFDVVRAFKGPEVPQIAVVHDNSSCDLPFATGEEWLVYGHEAIGGIATDSCSRSRLKTAATQDLVYLESAAASRPQGIVYGEVFRRREDGPSGAALSAVLEPLQVIAANMTQTFSTTTERWGPFELVLPPGDFQVWVERGQKPVGPKRVVHVNHGADVKLRLVVEYSDAPQ